jgi:hypothetical protein
MLKLRREKPVLQGCMLKTEKSGRRTPIRLSAPAQTAVCVHRIVCLKK